VETDCHDIVVEENPQVKSVGLFLKFQPMGFKEITHDYVICNSGLS